MSPSLLDAAAPAPGGRVTVPPGPASPEPQSLTCLGDQRKERKPQRRGHGNSRRGRSPRRPRPRAPICSESRSRLSSTSWRSNWLNAAWPCTDAAAASLPTAVTRPSGRKRSTTAFLSLRNTACGWVLSSDPAPLSAHRAGALA